MGKVEINAFVPLHRIPLGVREYLYQGEKASQPDLMILAQKALRELGEADFPPTLFHHYPRHRDLDPKKLIPFSIFPWPGLEKTG